MGLSSGRIVGLLATTPDGLLAIRAGLVIGADGQGSMVGEKARPVARRHFGAPMDVLWFRLSRGPSGPPQTLGRIVAGRIFIMLNRGD